MEYALVARWLYLATRKKKDEIWLIPGTRFLSIVFKLVNIRGVVQHKWLMVWCVQWYNISHSVKDWHSIQLGFASLNRTPIFHLMRNLVPLHDQPLAICIRFAEEKNIRNVKWTNECTCRPTRNVPSLNMRAFIWDSSQKTKHSWCQLYFCEMLKYMEKQYT